MTGRIEDAERQDPREAAIARDVRLALGQLSDLVIWRNNVGTAQFWDGRQAQTVRYGLAVGSADFIAVLKPHGRFVALEIKSATGRVSPEQVQWLALVRSFGGFAAIVRSADDALAAIERARRGENQ